MLAGAPDVGICASALLAIKRSASEPFQFVACSLCGFVRRAPFNCRRPVGATFVTYLVGAVWCFGSPRVARLGGADDLGTIAVMDRRRAVMLGPCSGGSSAGSRRGGCGSHPGNITASVGDGGSGALGDRTLCELLLKAEARGRLPGRPGAAARPTVWRWWSPAGFMASVVALA